MYSDAQDFSPTKQEGASCKKDNLYPVPGMAVNESLDAAVLLAAIELLVNLHEDGA